MSSTTPKVVIATAHCPLIKDCVIKGYWNENMIEIGNIFIMVDKNIHDYGGGQNTRCLVVIKEGIATVNSFSNSMNTNNMNTNKLCYCGKSVDMSNPYCVEF